MWTERPQRPSNPLPFTTVIKGNSGVDHGEHDSDDYGNLRSDVGAVRCCIWIL